MNGPTRDYAVLALLWVAWCAVHSGMISVTATDYLTSRLGGRYRYYRLVFNFIALLTLIPVVLYGRSIPGPVLFRFDGWTVIGQVVLLAIAGLLFILGARLYDIPQFLGLRQLSTGSSHRVLTKSGGLKITGVLGVTRHPWYLGTLLFVWAANATMDVSTLIRNLVLTGYLFVGSFLEERKLLREFGDDYLEYQNRVGMMFPTQLLKPKSRRS